MGLTIRSTDMGILLSRRPRDGQLLPNTDGNWTVNVRSNPAALRITATLSPNRANNSVVIAYPSGGPSLDVRSLGYAAQHANTTPWTLLSEGAVPGGWNISDDVAKSGQNAGLLGFKFTAATDTASASINSGPVGTLTIGKPENRPYLSVVTQGTVYISGGLTITFNSVGALASFASVEIPVVLGWMASATGVSWSPIETD